MLSVNMVMRLISFWPPYLAAGISVQSFDLEKGELTTRLKSSRFNRGYFGTHFGGSLYSMCDPFYVFMLANFLGRDYYVWDRRSTVEYLKAVSEPVYATFHLPPETAKAIAEQAKDGQKVEPEFTCEVRTASGEVVARIVKTLYVRKKKR